MENNENGITIEKIERIREKFDNIKNKYTDDLLFCEALDAYLNEENFNTIDKIREEYEKETCLDRDLRIGIVGSVKAGKSSLLNALFFEGKDILPKAATPMTAALTELAYGEEIVVEIDFFTDDDIEQLKKKSELYQKQLQAHKTQFLHTLRLRKGNDLSESQEDETRAEQRAVSALKDKVSLSGAHEQYQSILKSMHLRKTGAEKICLNNIEEIATCLSAYVGSTGEYMPFTSKVSLRLPFEALKGICVIDTPGFNDPVPSRDERARQALNVCDVILILSPARQFLSSNDKEALEKITATNGIRELYIVQSQIDSQLFSPEIVEEADGDIDVAVERVISILNSVTEENLSSLTRKDVFLPIIQNVNERCIPTSGLCESMAATFEFRVTAWDSGRQHLWNRLKEKYPDYFSESDEDTSRYYLKQLGNIGRIEKCLQAAKERKKDIFLDKVKNFEVKYDRIAQAVLQKITSDINSRIAEFQTMNISQMEKNIKIMKASLSYLTDDLNQEFSNSVLNWYDEVLDRFRFFLLTEKEEASKSIEGGKGERSESWTTGWWLWKEHHSREIKYVHVGEVKNAIEDYISNFENRLPIFIRKSVEELIATMQRNVMESIKSEIGDKDTDNDGINYKALKNKIRNILNAVVSNDNQYSYTGPTFQYDSGVLENEECEQCLSAARQFLKELQRNFTKNLSRFLDNFIQYSGRNIWGKELMGGYISGLEKKYEELTTPKEAVARLMQIKNDLSHLLEC